jgi:hypothetical protein
VRLGIRTLLVALAVVLFVVAALTDENQFEFMTIGLAVFAASFIVEDVVGGYFRRNT